MRFNTHPFCAIFNCHNCRRHQGATTAYYTWCFDFKLFAMKTKYQVIKHNDKSTKSIMFRLLSYCLVFLG